MSAATAEVAQVHPNGVSPEPGAEVGAARFALASRLVDSLLHDVRNPLNAMAIHLDVLTEKLKVDGKVPPAQEKNLKAIREQIFRVDGLLRHYADFLSDRPQSANDGSFSELVQRAVQVLGHEARKGQVALKHHVEPDVRLHGPAVGPMTFVVAQALLRAISRSPPGTELSLQLGKEAKQAVLRVRDGGGQTEPSPFALPALESVTREHGGQLRVTGPELLATLPLG